MGRPLPVISVPPPSPHRAGEGGSCEAAVWGSECRDVESWGARGDVWQAYGGLGGAGGLRTTLISIHGVPVSGWVSVTWVPRWPLTSSAI